MSKLTRMVDDDYNKPRKTIQDDLNQDKERIISNLEGYLRIPYEECELLMEGIRIKYLSIDKYEICEDKEACNGKGRTGIIFFNTAKGSYSENKYEFINGFPLKKLIPEWITEFEKPFLIEKK